MNILMTTDTVGGVWTYSLELARSLQPHGVEVVMASMGAPLSTTQRQEIEQVKNIICYESDLKLEWMEDPWSDLQTAGRWLLNLEKIHRPDVVHLNNYVHGAMPWSAPVVMVGHSCVLSWWRHVLNEEAPHHWDCYRELVTNGLRAADVVVAPTCAMLADLERYYGPFCRTCVIPNGRSDQFFFPAIKEPYILTAGRLWDKAKNIAALQTVAPQLSWPIYVAGSNQSPDGGRIDFAGLHSLGQLDAEMMSHWLSRAALYISPARYEPFGLSAIEAGLAGCALILGDIPSLREVWDEAAIFVHPDNEQELVRSVEEMIADPVRREQYAERARRRALQFTPQRMACNYLDLYCTLLNEKAYVD